MVWRFFYLDAIWALLALLNYSSSNFLLGSFHVPGIRFSISRFRGKAWK